MEQADQEIEITIYTDPLCCWSWAFEPQLQQLQKDLGGKATWQYRMGGLLPSWENFHDEVNAVTRPVQMGPVWMHAGQIAGLPIQHQLWMRDPPASSYPACIAVKCAQLQSAALGELMLRLLREACMTEGKNIARQTVLFDTAEKLASIDPCFNLEQFKDDLSNDKGLEA
ncbi:MAG TPA: DsbA family protein, partial [Chitinophagaceae bacterium]|nr:DsbA family protein [Chitinophagaceae bacterium]